MSDSNARTYIEKLEFTALIVCSVALWTGAMLSDRFAPSVDLGTPGANGWIISRLVLAAGLTLSGLVIVIARLVAIGLKRYGMASYLGWWLVAIGIGLAGVIWFGWSVALPLLFCVVSACFVTALRYRNS